MTVDCSWTSGTWPDSNSNLTVDIMVFLMKSIMRFSPRKNPFEFSISSIASNSWSSGDHHRHSLSNVVILNWICSVAQKNRTKHLKSWKELLQNFDVIKDVRANCFCASLLRTQMHTPRHTRARALSNKMRNDRAKGHCYSFAWI